VTLDVDKVAAQEAAQIVGAQAGMEVRLPEDLLQTPVTLKFEDAQLLRVLDTFARQTGRAYEFEGADIVAFTKEPFVDYPAAYVGPLKLKIVRVRTTGENDFVGKKSNVDLTFALEHEPRSAPAKPLFKVVSAADEAGAAVEWRQSPPGGDAMNFGRIVMGGRAFRIGPDGAVVEEDSSGGGTGKVTLRNIPSILSGFRSLVCEVTLSVDTKKSKKVEFQSPQVGDAVTVGGLEVRVVEVDEEWIEVEVCSKSGGKVERDLVNGDSIVLSSGDKQFEGRVMEEDDLMGLLRDAQDMARLMRRIERLQGGVSEDRISFAVEVPAGAREGGVDVLSFSLREVVEHKVKFTFRDLKLR
jgi:hypothetical protein